MQKRLQSSDGEPTRRKNSAFSSKVGRTHGDRSLNAWMQPHQTDATESLFDRDTNQRKTEGVKSMGRSTVSVGSAVRPTGVFCWNGFGKADITGAAHTKGTHPPPKSSLRSPLAEHTGWQMRASAADDGRLGALHVGPAVGS